ncbi:MAG: enoyl-CoA hydratase-related protein [Dehalococcoidia bacterium]|nr:enoyl-CoA hydratase-related protein [Dehalococcoidia bacterium]
MPIDTERHDGVCVPAGISAGGESNSIDAEDVRGQLGAAWEEFEHDDELKVAIVTGAGEKAFCAGRDLVKSANDTDGDWSRARAQNRLTPDGIWKPVIAAANGHCLAAAAGARAGMRCMPGGVAERDVRDDGSEARDRGGRRADAAALRGYIPFGKAMEMILFAERIDAEEAHRLHLVNALAPEGGAFDMAMEWAQKLLLNGPLAMQAMKRAAYEGGFNMPLPEGLKLEARLYAEILETDDAKEGPRAFAEKRQPDFKGR